MDVENLRNVLLSESSRIQDLSRSWQDTLNSNLSIPEEYSGRIRAQIGLSRLLVNDKLQQFARLLDTYESGNPDSVRKMTLCDLQGFWDLVYIQVEDTVKKFHALEILKQNNWDDMANMKSVATAKRRTPLVSIMNVDSLGKSTVKKDHTEDARRRLALAKQRMQIQREDISVATTSLNCLPDDPKLQKENSNTDN